jgi:hypothetical protein
MIAHLKIPILSAGFGIQAIKLALEVLMHSFAYVKAPVRHAGRGKHMLHLLFVVKSPYSLAGKSVQTVDGAARRKAYIMYGGNVNAITNH